MITPSLMLSITVSRVRTREGRSSHSSTSAAGRPCAAPSRTAPRGFPIELPLPLAHGKGGVDDQVELACVERLQHVAVRIGLARPPQQVSFRIGDQVDDRNAAPAGERPGDFEPVRSTVGPEVDEGQIGTRAGDGPDRAARAGHGGGHRVSETGQALLKRGGVGLRAGDQDRRAGHRALLPWLRTPVVRSSRGRITLRFQARRGRTVAQVRNPTGAG